MQSFNREDYIHKLEKENTELQQKWLDESYEKAKLVGQLNKAKELLREIIDTPVFIQMGGESYENEGYTELVEEVEDFLKEVE